MNQIRLECEKDGKSYGVATAMPDLKGFSGKMSTYSGLHGVVSKMLWQLAAAIESGKEKIDKDGLLGQK